MDTGLAPGVEVSALIRQTEGNGGFATLVHKGDPDRGAILLVVSQRGQHHAVLERALQRSGQYGWQCCGPRPHEADQLSPYLARRRSADPDCWVLELDIPHAERFVAETTATS
ncbi:DUF1491 family protein [Sphingomonas sp. GCM10030256]|uniref:DUF1491 family protein n=1 Tax=Sphingomonas sp. GCM10030256 TaxID=3273427 RepID=UPI0036181F56